MDGLRELPIPFAVNRLAYAPWGPSSRQSIGFPAILFEAPVALTHPSPALACSLRSPCDQGLQFNWLTLIDQQGNTRYISTLLHGTFLVLDARMESFTAF